MNNEHDCRVCLLFGKTTLMRRVGIILRLVLWYAVVVIVTSEKSELELHPWLNETKRTTEYYSRGHKWPPTFRPNTEGWKLLYGRRFEQIMHLDETHERENKYDGWFVNTLSGLILPNMTENGWGITRAPQELVTELRAAIHQGLQQQGSTTTPRLEHETGVVKGPRSWMIDRPDLLARTIKELQPYAEAWSGTALIPHQAYGFRLYRNDSRLTMHIDKTSTHVISFILHIDSSDDAEPWPLVIEDFQGNTNEVILTSGDMLFYESAKCIHGRPTRFHGTWYSSVRYTYYLLTFNSIHHNMISKKILKTKTGVCALLPCSLAGE